MLKIFFKNLTYVLVMNSYYIFNWMFSSNFYLLYLYTVPCSVFNNYCIYLLKFSAAITLYTMLLFLTYLIQVVINENEEVIYG